MGPVDLLGRVQLGARSVSPIPSLLLVFTLATSGCFFAADGEPAGPSDEFVASSTQSATALDEVALVAAAMRYESGDFVQVSEMYDSSAAPGKLVRVFASHAAAAAYRQISPDAHGSGAELPEGALIVREVLDAQGKLVKLTMLARGPKGYNPSSGDLWFAATDLEGHFLREGMDSSHGPLATCSSCHAGRARDGFLFGVAEEDRSDP